MQRLPKLTNAGRTKNLKGGAINFLVACLALACAQALAPKHESRQVGTSVPTRQVGGKLSDPLAGSRRCFGTNANLLEDRKTLCRPGHFGGQKDRETHSASSFGMNRREIGVEPLSHFRPRSDARRKLRLSDGRERGATPMSSRQFDLASGRSMRRTKGTSVASVSSA